MARYVNKHTCLFINLIHFDCKHKVRFARNHTKWFGSILSRSAIKNCFLDAAYFERIKTLRLGEFRKNALITNEVKQTTACLVYWFGYRWN